MTLDDFIDFAAAQDIDAVELTAYYFAETTPEYLAGLKGRCTRLGLDVSGTAVGNNFCVPDPAKLKAELAMVKAWVEHTSRLGGKTIRIFAGNVAKGDTEEKARDRAASTQSRRRATTPPSTASTWPWRTTAASRRRPTRCWPSSRRSSTTGSASTSTPATSTRPTPTPTWSGSPRTPSSCADQDGSPPGGQGRPGRRPAATTRHPAEGELPGLRGAGVRGQGGRQGRGPAAPGDAQTTDGLTVVPVQSIATADFTSSSAVAIHFGRLLFTIAIQFTGFYSGGVCELNE